MTENCMSRLEAAPTILNVVKTRFPIKAIGNDKKIGEVNADL